MNQKRILLIDDEAGITRSMKTNLERTGNYFVRTENESTKALAAARDFKPEIIFLDLMMPEIDGSELAARFKADRELARVPLVFLTAIVSKAETGDEGMISGGHKFMAKPISLAALIACIEANVKSTEKPVQPKTVVTESERNDVFATSQI